jgi:RNA polymerase sigma factor (sigma-70 family)
MRIRGKTRMREAAVYNPFIERQNGTDRDQELIEGVLQGGSAELESLILRHQAWIYNIALGMTLDASEAEDITQEILIKMITSLSTYDRTKASFRTWLYRIVANHVLSQRRGKKEEAFSSLVTPDAYHEYVESIPDEKAEHSPEHKALSREARNTCVAGMLLCLDKRQRLVFILGAIFGLNDATGSEILDMSRDNFRKILSRSRSKLSNFFASTCSLVNEKNPCTCSRWVEPMQKLSLIGREGPGGTATFRPISEVVQDRARQCLDLYDREMIRLYRNLPFAEPPDMVSWIRKAIATDQFRTLMDLN